MKRLLAWLRNWLCSDLEWRHGVLIVALDQQMREQNEAQARWRGAIVSDVEQRLATDRELRDAVLNDLVSQINKLREQLNERQAELPAGRRVARTFSEFRAAAEGRPKEKR